jgi:GT2 family glycosyltransferase
MTRPVRIVVVAFHAPGSLDRCLATIAGSVEITVVDNSSADEIAAVARRNGAEYFDSGWNSGFAAGVNVALRSVLAGTPRDVLLLNPDAVLEHSEVEKLSGHLHRPGNERLGTVAPRLVGADGTDQRVAWPFPSPVRAWAEAVGLGGIDARHVFMTGAALLLRWEALQEVGLFDERFFLYAEEADWQRRALARGWIAAVCQDAVGFHAGAGTSADPAWREAIFHAAQEVYIRKWYGQSGWLIYRCAVLVGAAARAVVLPGDRRAAAARRARLYARGPRRSLGLLERT